MGDPLSITASIIAILQAASATAACLDGVRHAAKDTKDLIKELRSLQSILTSLRDYAGANPDSTTLQTFGADLRECLSDMEELRAELEPKSLIRKGVLRLGWVLKGRECREHLDKIERLKSSISLAMDLDRESRSKAIAIWTKKGVEDEKRKKVLTWLNPTAYDERHLEISNRRQSNTGEWLLKEAVVVDWIGGNPSRRLLLGYGIPGAGKTFLSSLMIDDLRRRAIAKNWGVAFMYFNHSEQNQQTPTFFLSSLVKQFACQLDLPEQFCEQLYKLHDNVHPKQLEPAIDQLYDLLIAVTRPFTQAFIICDALDECDQQSQRKKLLPLFNRMGKDGMRLFLTSREHPEDIQHAFQSAAKIKLSAQNEDIRVYIERKIAESPRAERLVEQAKCKEDIISELQACANGMFLLVHFHIRYLCEQTTPRQLLVALGTLKDSSSASGESPMDPTYNRAIKTIQSQPKRSVELAVSILTWLVKSRRVLSVRELQQAVLVEQHQSAFDELALPSEKTMIDVCASLVAIDQESNTVRLVHYTVKEYLVNNSIIPEDAEFRIVMACATFLSYEDFSEDPSAKDFSDSPFLYQDLSEGSFTGAPLKARYEIYPFLRYADMNFVFHLQQCDEALSLDLVLRLLKNRQNMLSYLKAYLEDHEYLFEKHILNDCDNLLNLAACLGHTAVIQSLLSQGANVSGQGKFALDIAAELGYNSMIEVLLENGAEMTPEALPNAIVWNHVSTIRLLIDKGALVSATDTSGQTPLHIAAEFASWGVVKILLKNGASTSVTDTCGKTPLHIAAEFANWEVVRILLKNGASASATDTSGQTPLHNAASSGSDESVRVVGVLLGNGADISATDEKGQTPLHKAASCYDEEIVQTLLENGADISVTDKEGRTPLHIAASHDSQKAVGFLVENGADVSATDSKGQTPLHIAAGIYYNRKVVGILLEKGADAFATDNAGNTPMQRAKNPFIAKILSEYQVRDM